MYHADGFRMLTPSSDSSAASWIIESLHGFAQDVGSIVPPVFTAYLRVFHPARIGSEDGRRVTWAEVAKANRRTSHPEMQFHALVPHGFIDQAGNMLDRQWGLWESLPEEGSLDRDIIELLLPILRGSTQTPERCWFAFWDGWGVPVPLTRPDGILSRVFRKSGEQPQVRGSGHESDRHRAPRFSIPSRDLLLLEGTLDDALEGFYEPHVSHSFQSAYFWWPKDRAWCVATEIDFMSTYIGAGKACSEAIVHTPGIEALPTNIDDRITGASDTINPNPDNEL